MLPMEVSIPAGAQAVLPQPERTPVAIRAAIARLDPAALARFEEDWAATMTRAREEYSVLPVRQLVEHWRRPFPASNPTGNPRHGLAWHGHAGGGVDAKVGSSAVARRWMRSCPTALRSGWSAWKAS